MLRMKDRFKMPGDDDEFFKPFKHFRWIWVLFAVFFAAAIAFNIWAMKGPCSKPINEAPAWCLSMMND